MYGDGLTLRSARYSDSGAAGKGCAMRCDSTTCMMSPSKIYCLALTTAFLNAASPNSERASQPPRHGVVDPPGAGGAAKRLLPQSAGFASNVSQPLPFIGGARGMSTG